MSRPSFSGLRRKEATLEVSPANEVIAELVRIDRLNRERIASDEEKAAAILAEAEAEIASLRQNAERDLAERLKDYEAELTRQSELVLTAAGDESETKLSSLQRLFDENRAIWVEEILRKVLE